MMNKKSFTWGTIGAIILGLATLYGVYLQHRDEERKSGGAFEARFHENSVSADSRRTIVVCTDNVNNELTNVSVSPTINNPSRYPLPGFSLELHVDAYNMELTPTDFYPMSRLGENEFVFTYKDDKLLNQHFTPKAFQSLRIKQGRLGRCTIHTTATYEGTEHPFVYDTDVWLLLVPNTKHLPFENWRLSCKKAIYEHVETGLIYDEYYFDSQGQTYHDFDLSLPVPANESVAQTTTQDPAEPAATPSPVQSIAPRPAITKSETSKPIAHSPTVSNSVSTVPTATETVSVSRSPNHAELRLMFPIVNDTTYYIYALTNATQDSLRRIDWLRVTPPYKNQHVITLNSPTDTLIFLQAAPDMRENIEASLTDDGFIHIKNTSKEPVVAFLHLSNGSHTTRLFDYKTKSYTFSYGNNTRVVSIDAYRYDMPDNRSWWDKWGGVLSWGFGALFFLAAAILGIYVMTTTEDAFSSEWWESLGCVVLFVFFVALFIWLIFETWP